MTWLTAVGAVVAIFVLLGVVIVVANPRRPPPRRPRSEVFTHAPAPVARGAAPTDYSVWSRSSSSPIPRREPGPGGSS